MNNHISCFLKDHLSLQTFQTIHQRLVYNTFTTLYSTPSHCIWSHTTRTIGEKPPSNWKTELFKLKEGWGPERVKTKSFKYTRVLLSARTDNETAPISAQRGTSLFVILTGLSVQVGLIITRSLVIHIYDNVLLSVQTKDIRINLVRIMNQAEGSCYPFHG